MEQIIKLYTMLTNGFEMVLDLWPIKAAAAMLSSLFCFLFGGSEAILLAVIVFVALDTATKWVAITKKYCTEYLKLPTECLSALVLVCQFFHAWRPGYLTSTALRQCWGEKLITYSVLIIFAGYVLKLPEMTVAAVQVNKAISGGIYATIAVTELFSIMENLEEMGNTKVALLKQYICTIADKIAGSTFSVTIKSGDKDKGAGQ